MSRSKRQLGKAPNAWGTLALTADRDSIALGIVSAAVGKPVDRVEIEWGGLIYHTPGRPFAIDPDNSCPDECEDERHIESITIYAGGNEIKIDPDGEDGELIEEILIDDIYDSEAHGDERDEY
jgi:hypothetical protein